MRRSLQPAVAGAPARRARPLRLGLLLAALAPSSSAYHPAAGCVGCGQQHQRVAAVPRAVLEVGKPAFSSQVPPLTPGVRPPTGTVGVLLLNLGGPDSLDNVEPFLYNPFSDPEIITLPSFLAWMNGPVAWWIAKSRAPTSREGYKIVEEACGVVSPQLSTTEEQGNGIVEALGARRA